MTKNSYGNCVNLTNNILTIHNILNIIMAVNNIFIIYCKKMWIVNASCLWYKFYFQHFYNLNTIVSNN